MIMELYVLKSAACWALLYGFYKLLLERESMHQLKRWYLLGGLVLGALIPLVTFTTYITADAGSVSYIIRTEEVSTVTNPSFWESIDYMAILWRGYWLGFTVFAARFVESRQIVETYLDPSEAITKTLVLCITRKAGTTPHFF